MNDRRPRLFAFFLALLVVAGTSASNASILTVIDPNCTGFSLGGVAPNQTLDCVGGGTGVPSPLTLILDAKHCDNFTLGGIAPNQTLVCSVSAAPVLVSAVSRKVHGAAGTFDLPLSLDIDNPSVEPRFGPAQTIVMTFDRAIAAATPHVIEGSATLGTATISGNSVITPLVAVGDQQYVRLALTGVTATSGGIAGSAWVRAGFLAGDVSQNGVVTVSDAGAVNLRLAQPLTATNYLYDVNASGAVTIADKGATTSNLAKALPPP